MVKIAFEKNRISNFEGLVTYVRYLHAKFHAHDDQGDNPEQEKEG